MYSLLHFLILLTVVPVLVFAWWGLGQYLRKRGYGARLDHFGNKVEQVQNRANTAALKSLSNSNKK